MPATTIRKPMLAGQFYPASQSHCFQQLKQCIQGIPSQSELKPEQCVGAIVPHAGWVYSGGVTGKTLQTFRLCAPETVVLIGAVHAVRTRRTALFDRGSWQTPLGTVEVDSQLADVLVPFKNLIDVDDDAHAREHSIEVQVPFIQFLFPRAKILPIMVPPSDLAVEVGNVMGRVLIETNRKAIIVGTTDLTHYGPRYEFTPHGVGPAGLDWAENINDRRMIDRILSLDSAEILSEAALNHNACGAGAVAATIQACLALDATRAVLIEHTTSRKTLTQVIPPSAIQDAVGYAGFVLAK